MDRISRGVLAFVLIVIGALMVSTALAPASRTIRVHSDVSIRSEGLRFSGRVDADGHEPCVRRRKIVLYRLEGGSRVIVGRDFTGAGGRWSIEAPLSTGASPGRFGAKADDHELRRSGPTHLCQAGFSRTIRATGPRVEDAPVAERARTANRDRGAFGNDGFLLAPGSATARVAHDGAGRILLAGGNRFALLVTRLHPDGRVDRTFGKAGTAAIDLSRFAHGPAAEEELGESGVARPDAISVAPSGEIFVAGTIDTDSGDAVGDKSILAALRPNGAPVAGFSGGRFDFTHVPGQRELGLTVHAILPRAGGLLIAGQGASNAVVDRLLPDGHFDPSFGVGRRPGQTSFPPPPKNLTRYYANAGFYGLRPGPGGTIYASGFDLGSLMLLQLRPDGALDRGFAGDGILELNPSARRACGCFTRGYLARDRRGRLLVAGSLEETSGVTRHKQIVVARFSPTGRLDHRFGADGFVRLGTGTTTAASGLAIDRGGRIIVVGSGPIAHPAAESPPTGLLAYRLLPDGRADAGFFGDGSFGSRFRSRYAGGSNVVLGADNDPLVAGGLLRGSRARGRELGFLARLRSG